MSVLNKRRARRTRQVTKEFCGHDWIVAELTFFSIKYVAAIIILSPVIGKLRDLAPGGNFSTLHDFKMVLGKNET